jgi:hypothetical protein
VLLPKNDFLQILLNARQLEVSLLEFAYSEAGQRHFGIFSQNNFLPRRTTSSFLLE